MPTAFQIGKTDHAAGKTLADNPFSESTQERTEWARGWTDADQLAAAGVAAASADGATASVGGTVAAGATVSGGLGDPDDASTTEDTEEAEPLATLGEEGYKRLLELLDGAPLPGDVPSIPSGDVPTDLKEWLLAMKEPLVYMTVDTAVSAVRHRVGGTERGRLRELYKDMTPLEIAAVMQGNAAVIRKFADQRAGEAALIASMQQKVTNAGASFLLKALAFI